MVQVSPRNKWITGILSGTGVGLLAGILLCGGQSSSCNEDDFSVAEAKPLWQNNPAQVVELADLCFGEKCTGENGRRSGGEKENHKYPREAADGYGKGISNHTSDSNKT